MVPAELELVLAAVAVPAVAAQVVLVTSVPLMFLVQVVPVALQGLVHSVLSLAEAMVVRDLIPAAQVKMDLRRVAVAVDLRAITTAVVWVLADRSAFSTGLLNFFFIS